MDKTQVKQTYEVFSNYNLLHLSLPGHMSSLPSILQGVHVAQSVVLRLVFCRPMPFVSSFFF